MEVTHNNLPQAIEEILKKVEAIEKALNAKTVFDFDTKLSVFEAIEYEYQRTGYKPARQTIYGRCCRRTMPFMKNNTKTMFHFGTLKKWFDDGMPKGPFLPNEINND